MHHHKASKLEGQNLSICAGLELNNKASHVLADQTLRNVSIQLGASEATEGATGLYRQYQGQGAAGFNPVRSGLNAASPVWGDTIYDTTIWACLYWHSVRLCP